MRAPSGTHPQSSSEKRERAFYLAKLAILYLIIFIITGIGTLLVVELRHLTDTAQYAHDGGVLETESAIEFLMAGKNPYVETYRGTPAEKLGTLVHGLSHYPYLPWSFLASVPFYVASKATLGWYDQRFVYLIALALSLALIPKLARRPSDKLALIALVGLNPIMGNDIVYGMNDVLVVVWLILAAYLLKIERTALSAGALGLAMVTKGTAWPLLPFYLLYIFRHELWQFASTFRGARAGLKPAPTEGQGGKPAPGQSFLKLALKAASVFELSSIGRIAPLAVTSLAVMLPFVFWNAGALVEDVWSYNMGSPVVDPLPIKGWGMANVVLSLGWVKSVWEFFPFSIFEGLFALPLLAVLLFRQWRQNTLDSMLLNFGLFSLVFFYLSRTMNANYVGFALVFVAVGYFADEAAEEGRV